MRDNHIEIIKTTGEKVSFSAEKLRNSLKRSGADQQTVLNIVKKVEDELYQGISTKEIYNRAFALLKKKKSFLASRYKLKKGIFELGPTGFPFERFISALLKYSGYKTQVGKIIKGNCVSHEIDIVAEKNNTTTVVECKFHSDDSRHCSVKIPLYIAARFADVKLHWDKSARNSKLNEGWVVTNTRFTKDAIEYGTCIGLYMLSWNYPKENALKDRIDRLGLYPITVSTLLTKREKQFLLSRDVVLCRDLLGDVFYLDHLGVSEVRKEKILNEIKLLCQH